jgi:glycosyltransferase involved in cell wall biosynthesis
MKKKLKSKVYFDGFCIATEKISGIGHITLETIRSLSENVENPENIVIISPLFKKKYIISYKLGIKIKTIPLPAKIFNALLALNLIPPMDLIFGKGTYIFTNFRNWPLMFSKSITYIHDLSFINHPETTESKNLKYLNNGIAIWSKRSDLIITASEYSKKSILENLNISSGKVEIIHHGVDKRVFNEKQDATRVRDILNKYGISNNEYILYVGNVEPRKNLLTLLRAYKIIPRDLALKTPLMVVGSSGWKNDDIYVMLAEGIDSGYIIKPNAYVEDSDLPAFYFNAKALVQPAIEEGFGMSPLQALSCGVNVILSDIEVFKEIFGENEHIKYFDVYDSLGLNKLLINVIKSTYTKKFSYDLYEWSDASVKLLANIHKLEQRGR